jgi:hypothetical protein
MKKPFTKIAAGLFGFGAAVHLLRLILHFSVVIAGYPVPLYVNVFGVLAGLTFAAMLWRESQ